MQGSYLSLLQTSSDKPLEYWSKEKSLTGSIKRIFDEQLNENILDIQDKEEANSQKTWIMCPPNTDQLLMITIPILVFILKSTINSFYIQLQLIDKENVRHIITFSNVEQKKVVNKLSLHLVLEPGWNKIEFDLNFLSKIYQTEFIAVTRIRITANCRIKRIYFIDKHYNEDEMSHELYQGFLDNYMLKWGIKGIEKTTQTKKTSNKDTIKKHSILYPVNDFSRLFLKNLQAKSDNVVDEFFNSRSVKSVKTYLNFKQKAKLKPYAISGGTKSNFVSNNSISSIIDLNDMKESVINHSYLYQKLFRFDKPLLNHKDIEPKIIKKKNQQKNTSKQPATHRHPEILRSHRVDNILSYPSVKTKRTY